MVEPNPTQEHTPRLPQVEAKCAALESAVARLEQELAEAFSADKAKELGQLRTQLDRLTNERALLHRLAQAEALINEEGEGELAKLAREEVESLKQELEAFTATDAGDSPDHKRGAILEIRAGAGGEEAALFAGVLARMYRRYAETHGWAFEEVSLTHTDLGGLREGVFSVGAGGALGLRFESGVHRVQRVPITEAGGRIHTSTATVAVLPEVAEVELEIKPQELRVDTYRAGGAGGQHVNRTDSAVRITHLPTGIVAQCQDEKSQHRNRAAALSVLRARLYDRRQEQARDSERSLRRGQVGSGDRSERIRTYNYPQNRVTDHRIGFSLRRLDAVLEGDALSEVLSALRQAEAQAQKESEIQ